MPAKREKKDRWDKFQIVAALLIPASIAYVGYRYTTALKEAEIESAREIAAGEEAVAQIQTRIRQAELVKSFLEVLTDKRPAVRKIGVEAILLALPMEGPRMVSILAEEDPDETVQAAAKAGLTNNVDRAYDLLGESRIRFIPVAAHVLYRDEAENLSDARIESQIEALNRDFRARNEDIRSVPREFKPFVGDARIEFFLAKNDPNGSPTNGITRTKTTMASFSADDKMKSSDTGGVDPWPTNKYLNIWICTLRDGFTEYSQFPGGPSATDGIVVSNKVFGTVSVQPPFDKGRSAVHSVGHYLNLRHIWGDSTDCSGTDSVPDTPVQQAPHSEAPEFPSPSCGNEPNGDMFMNFMDYTPDAGALMFTKGQVVRMWETLKSTRRELGEARFEKSL